MRCIFGKFYDSSVNFYKICDAANYGGKCEKVPIAAARCDAQPINGDLLDKENGFLKTVKMKIYFSDDVGISVGDYAEIDGEDYIITRITKRNLGYSAYIERREIYGN